MSNVWSRLLAPWRMAAEVKASARTDATMQSIVAQVMPFYMASTATGMSYAQLVAAYQSWVYIAVNKVATTVASLPLRLYTYQRTDGTGEKFAGHGMRAAMRREGVPVRDAKLWLKAKGIERVEVESHPVLELFRKPNTWQTRYSLWVDSITKLELGGQCVWYIGAGLPTQILPLPLRSAATLAAIPDARLVIGGWRYTDGNVDVKMGNEEVLVFRFPTPLSPLECTSPLLAQQYPYKIDSYMQQLVNNVYETKAMPGTVLATDDRLSTKQVQQIVAEINDQLGGVTNAGKPMVLHSGLKLSGNMKFPLNEVISEEVARGISRDKVLAAYGVPAGKVGLVEDVNRANMEALDRSYLQETIRPLLMLIEEVIESGLLPRYDARLMADFELPEIQERETDIKERATNLDKGYTTINEERTRQHLDPVPWGDRPWMPFGLTQPEGAPDGTEVPVSGAPAPDTSGGGGATGEGLLPTQVLNGAQVQALTDLCQRVLDGFPRESAIGIAQVSFGLAEADAQRIIPAQGTKPEPEPPPVQAPPVPPRAPVASKDEAEDVGVETEKHVHAVRDGQVVVQKHTTKDDRQRLVLVWTPERRNAAAKAFESEHARFEAKFRGAAQHVFQWQEKYVLAQLSAHYAKHLARTHGWGTKRRAQYVKAADVTATYNLRKPDAQREVIKTFEPLMKECVAYFGERRGAELLHIAKSLGVEITKATPAPSTGIAFVFNANDKRVQKWLGDRLDEFSAEIVGTTFDDVKAVLRAGFEAGAPEADIAEALRQKFNAYDGYRAQLIARTETTASANFADLESVVQADLQDKLRKVWVDSSDEATRDTHREAGARYADGIAIEEQFEVGGDTMDAPGLGSLGEENINCRCTLGYTEA